MNDETTTPVEAQSDEAKQKKIRRARGEAESLPVRDALRRSKSLLKTAFNTLHFVQEINGLNPGDRFHAQGDLEEVKNQLTKIQPAVSRLEGLLK